MGRGGTVGEMNTQDGELRITCPDGKVLRVCRLPDCPESLQKSCEAGGGGVSDEGPRGMGAWGQSR